jgi:hypothetical protein
MAYGFARQSGGTLTIESETGRGTTVSLYLPLVTTDTLEPPVAMPVTRSVHRVGSTCSWWMTSPACEARCAVRSNSRAIG